MANGFTLNFRKMSHWLETPIKGLLLDITGVLWESGSDKAINGSIEAVGKLQAARFPFKFVTNETQHTRTALASKLQKFGFMLTEDNIFSPGPAVKAFLLKSNLRPHFLIHPRLLPEFNGCNTSEPNCVVIGDAAEHFTYENINYAFRTLIHMEKPRLISMGKGKYYKEAGELVLDLGPFVAGLEYACGITAEVIGKPGQQFFHSALGSLGISPKEAVMIGDDICSDVGGAQACGMRGVLVKTGKYRPSDQNHPHIKPDAIVENLLEAVNTVLKVHG